MVNLNDVINTAIGTGITAYGLATGIKSLGDHTLRDAATDATTLYAAAISAGATALYTTVNMMLKEKPYSS